MFKIELCFRFHCEYPPGVLPQSCKTCIYMCRPVGSCFWDFDLGGRCTIFKAFSECNIANARKVLNIIGDFLTIERGIKKLPFFWTGYHFDYKPFLKWGRHLEAHPKSTRVRVCPRRWIHTCYFRRNLAAILPKYQREERILRWTFARDSLNRIHYNQYWTCQRNCQKEFTRNDGLLV